MLDYAKSLVRNLNVFAAHARVAVVTFAEQAVVRNQLNEHQTTDQLVNSLSFPFAGGSTNMTEMLRFVCTCTQFTQIVLQLKRSWVVPKRYIYFKINVMLVLVCSSNAYNLLHRLHAFCGKFELSLNSASNLYGHMQLL